MFWASTAVILYTYAGYPLLIWALARLRPAPVEAGLPPLAELPRVSVCISVYNEQSRIERKLENLRQLDYPRDLLEILIASDGSTDGTAEILKSVRDVKFIDGPRGGKAAALARAVDAATGEVIVFTDARQSLSSNAIMSLVARLRQNDVGAVSGLLVFAAPQGGDAQGADLYWRYESWIRRQESRLHSLVGASGALYAMRRTNIRMPEPGTILDDFEIPIQVVRRRLRIVLEDSAIAFDVASTVRGSEKIRKIRTLAGNFQSFVQQPWLFSPFRNPIWWQFVSHKVLRLAVPFLMAIALVTSAFSAGGIYGLATASQLAFYLVAVAGLLLPGLRRIRLINISSVFLELNLAAITGLFVYATGQSHKAWRQSASTDRVA